MPITGEQLDDDDREVGRRSTQREVPQRDTQRRRRQTSTDPFYVDPSEVPHNTTWEWKRVSTFGQPDQENQITAKEAGWLPVMWKDRWESKHPPGITEVGLSEPVIRKGLMLMERPNDLTWEARQEDTERANAQMRDKFKELGQAPPDTMPRAHKNIPVKVSRTYAPAGMEVPEE